MAVADTLGVGVPLGVAVTETDGLGDAGGAVVGVPVGDALGEGLGEPAGVAGARPDGVARAVPAGVWPWAGPTRSGVCTRWRLGARKRNMAAATTPSTATTPPVAAPAAKARRSRRYSVCRRSRSQTAAWPAARPSC